MYRYLLGLSKDAQNLNAEQVMDRILGITKDGVVMEDEHDDGAGMEDVDPNNLPTLNSPCGMLLKISQNI